MMDDLLFDLIPPLSACTQRAENKFEILCFIAKITI